RNLESGNFDGVGAVDTGWDRALDREVGDPAPGAQRFEKMAAGHYLGEILRRAAEDLRRTGALFQWRTGTLATPVEIDGADLSEIAADQSDERAAVDGVLRRRGVESMPGDRRALGRLARAVGARSARLIAAGLLGTIGYIDPDGTAEHTIVVDGSV